MTAAELVEEGIRAYTRGDLEEARARWSAALAASPGDERIASYLALVTGPAVSAVLPRPAAPVPLPASRAPAPPPLPRRPASPAAEPARARDPFAPVARADRTTLEDYPAPRDAPADEPAPSPWEEEPTDVAPVVVAEGGGLDLASVDEQSGIYSLVPQTPASHGAPTSEVDVWMQGARELSALGDFSGSLELIERILKVAPLHAEAREYLAHNESTLISMYESKLGPPGAMPRLAISPEEVTWLTLDHRAGFLLAQIDGTVSYEDLFALSGLPRLDTARILAQLLAQGVIR